MNVHFLKYNIPLNDVDAIPNPGSVLTDLKFAYSTVSDSTEEEGQKYIIEFPEVLHIVKNLAGVHSYPIAIIIPAQSWLVLELDTLFSE